MLINYHQVSYFGNHIHCFELEVELLYRWLSSYLKCFQIIFFFLQYFKVFDLSLRVVTICVDKYRTKRSHAEQLINTLISVNLQCVNFCVLINCVTRLWRQQDLSLSVPVLLFKYTVNKHCRGVAWVKPQSLFLSRGYQSRRSPEVERNEKRKGPRVNSFQVLL